MGNRRKVTSQGMKNREDAYNRGRKCHYCGNPIAKRPYIQMFDKILHESCWNTMHEKAIKNNA